MNPRTLAPLFAASLIAAIPSHAQVTLTFDSDTEGFVEGTEGAGNVVWSDYNGGSLQITAGAGWVSPATKISLIGHETLSEEFELALANGGTLSYTFYLEPDGIVGSNPSWFQGIQVGNSLDTYDQSIGNSPAKGLPSVGFPLTETYVFEVSYPIEAGPAVDDARAQFNPDSGYSELLLGLNSQSGSGFEEATYYIDDFTIAANDTPGEVIIPTLDITKSTLGLNMITNGAGQYDRKMVRTSENLTLTSWVGTATEETPVTYSFTIADYPQNAGFASFIYLIPISNIDSPNDLTDPDYQAPDCARLVFERVTAGQEDVTGTFAYKVDAPGSNGPAGNDYFTADADPSSGLGGSLASINATGMLGTWSITFTSDTDFTISAPDGTSSSGAFLQETADLFDDDLYVYFGNMPGVPENIGLTAIYSNATISGAPDSFSDDFDAPLDPEVDPVIIAPDRGGVMVVTTDSPYWIEWSLPATGFLLQQSPDLGEVDIWEDIDTTDSINISGQKVTFLLTGDILIDEQNNYFRMERPEEPVEP